MKDQKLLKISFQIGATKDMFVLEIIIVSLNIYLNEVAK